MSKRLLLQNSLSYFIPDKTRDFGCIICGDNINFRRMTEDNFCLFSTDNALTEAFDKGYSLVFLLGDEGTGKSHVLRRFAYDMRNKFDAVVFVQYDDKKYIFSDDCGIYRDDDYTLSNCFYRIFTHDQFYTKDYSQAYFNKPSAKQLFLELRHRNTLLIIDELYVSYYPQYIDFLLENGFKIAVSVRSLPQNTPDNCCIVPLDFPDTVDVCRMIFDDKSSPDAEFVKLCKLFSNRLSALFFAKKFMDFYSYSAKELYNRIISISACENLNPVTDYIKIFYILADFSECEKEVLRSLGVICLHFIDTHDYENDEDILLTTQVAENLTTKSIKKWRRLIDLGFIGLLSDGELYMERHVSDFVLDILKPSSQNCPCLINNITCVFDINLSQLEKDFDALFSTQDLTVLVPNLTENIIDIFTYFISTDAEQYSTIYHVAFAYILNHLGPSTSHRYTNHLMWQNRCYFFHCFVNAMRDENFITSIFTKADNLDEYGEIYTPTIKAYLDILRVATSFIRFSSSEHYRQNEYIYYVITDVLDSIIYE
ncbi:MAG: hypothetical protein J6K12_00280, partial [Clostridia bacterium]|nr:hypothetical protein [Clostridia bacterium]